MSCNQKGGNDLGRQALIANANEASLQVEKVVEESKGYVDVYNAETGHWFSYPKFYNVINDSYGDTLNLISTDSLVSIRKWVDLESIPISFFDKDDDGDVDSIIDVREVLKLYDLSVEKYISKFDAKAIKKVKMNEYESQLEIDNNKGTIKATKSLLCNVVGGTLVPVFLEIEYNRDYKSKSEIEKVLDSFKRNFITSKK